MTNSIALSAAQQFEAERMNRAIDSTADIAALRGIAKQLFQAWQVQKSATQWAIRQQTARPFDQDGIANFLRGTKSE